MELGAGHGRTCYLLKTSIHHHIPLTQLAEL